MISRWQIFINKTNNEHTTDQNIAHLSSKYAGGHILK